MPKLEIKGITKVYKKGAVKALDGFTVTLTTGVYGLLGPNGAGKSTLMNIITDNLNSDKGEVLYDGENIKKLGKIYRSVLGYMPQQQGLYDDFTLNRFLWYMAALKGLKKKEAKEKITSLLDTVNLTNAAHKKLGGFSGGMKQRALIAQALLNDPKILILDEPQKLNGPATQKAMKRFNPLFSVNYSATHKQEHNEVYRLDAIDAYNHKLVKKIEVKGIEVVNLKGIDGYLYCDSFIKSQNKPPMVKLEFEQQLKSGTVKRVLRNCASGDNLYELSNGMLQYEGYKISDIDASDTGCVRFTNGEELHGGEVANNSQEMSDLRRVQIRETIKSHFEKEEQLFAQGIKTLSLFFIDNRKWPGGSAG